MNLYRAFQQAIDAPDPLQFAQNCSLDPEIKTELLKMIEAHIASEDFLAGDCATNLNIAVHARFGDLSGGTMLGVYRLIELLGQGSFGAVYRAVDTDLGRQVAVKVSKDMGSEAQTLAKLNHPHVVAVYGQGKDDQRRCRYIVMELIEGVDGGQYFSSPPQNFEPQDLIEIGIQLAEALTHAHAQGILHLDIKPSNVLFARDGKPYLSDFNVSSSRGNADIYGGTPGFMSPEQKQYLNQRLENQADSNTSALDATADIYGLAKTLLSFAHTIWDGGPPKSLNPYLRYLESASADAPKKRPQDARQFRDEQKNCLKLVRARRDLNRLNSKIASLNLSPKLLFLSVVMLPQILGSVVNITYNYSQIIGRLTPDQVSLFYKLVVAYNLTVYPICFGVVLYINRFSLKLYDKSISPTSTEMIKTIRQVPNFLILAISFGWLPGILLFPFLLDLLAGPVASVIYEVFAVSFLSGWLVSLTLSLMAANFVLVTMVVPQNLHAHLDLKQLKKPLTKLMNYNPKLRLMAGSIPLLGAVMLLVSQNNAVLAHELSSVKWLITALIFIGMLCYSFAYGVGDRIRESVLVLTRD